jgi:tetratricopeptide (TPR) repeat protein
MSLRDYSLSVTGQARHDAHEQALADAQQAIALAPDLAEAHLALAVLSHGSLDFAQAVPEFKRALDLAPGNARVLRDYGIFAVYMGWTEAGLDALRRARVLDPLSRDVHLFLGGALQSLGRYDESTAALRETLKIDPENSLLYVTIGLNFFMLGDFQTALSWCKAKPGEQTSACLALIYDKMGRYDDAKSALAEVTASSGDVFPYVVALIYAQWGNTAKALEWLEKAMQVRDPTLEQMKIDPFLDPLRKEPRFQAIEKALKFPK